MLDRQPGHVAVGVQVKRDVLVELARLDRLAVGEFDQRRVCGPLATCRRSCETSSELNAFASKSRPYLYFGSSCSG